MISAKYKHIEELLEWAREQRLRGHPDRLHRVGEEVFRRYAGQYRWLGRRDLILKVLERLEEREREKVPREDMFGLLSEVELQIEEDP